MTFASDLVAIVKEELKVAGVDFDDGGDPSYFATFTSNSSKGDLLPHPEGSISPRSYTRLSGSCRASRWRRGEVFSTSAAC